MSYNSDHCLFFLFNTQETVSYTHLLGGFSVYHLQTENGVVHVKRCYYGYKDGIMKSEDEGEYQTDYWRYVSYTNLHPAGGRTGFQQPVEGHW